jgi:hypothetical protein
VSVKQITWQRSSSAISARFQLSRASLRMRDTSRLVHPRIKVSRRPNGCFTFHFSLVSEGTDIISAISSRRPRARKYKIIKAQSTRNFAYYAPKLSRANASSTFNGSRSFSLSLRFPQPSPPPFASLTSPG